MFNLKNKNMSNFGRILLVFSFLLFYSCNQPKEEDEEITGEIIDGEKSDAITVSGWVESSFLTPLGEKKTLALKTLNDGGTKEPLELTHVQANYPVALFHGTKKGAVSAIPFLAFKVEEKSKISIRHIKSVNGQNVASQTIIPQTCPESFTEKADMSLPENAKAEDDDTKPEILLRLYCIPLINAVIPRFLVPTDNSGAYVHEFVISTKHPSKSASVLSTKIATRIIIPGSSLNIHVANEMKKLSLSDRLTIATNDLVGSPRRDFKAYEIRGDVAPGVETAWLLNFTDVKIIFEEEVFFEQPVFPGEDPAKPVVARGNAFYKRSTSINSNDHFKLRIFGEDDKKVYNLPGSAEIEIPITDGSRPLRVFLSPDFGSPTATKSMSEYVKPFSPTFCPTEQAGFKPEEWRQSRLNNYYVACEANIRTRVLDLADALSKGVTSPLETFFGAFSYMPRIGQRILGGTNGILSLRVSLSGTIKVSVRNPHDLLTITEIGEIPLSYTYLFPTVLEEMNNLIKSGKGSPGMDTILSAMQRKGILAIPDVHGVAAFPFMGQQRSDFYH